MHEHDFIPGPRPATMHKTLVEGTNARANDGRKSYSLVKRPGII